MKYRIVYTPIGKPTDLMAMNLRATSFEDAHDEFYKIYSKDQMVIEEIEEVKSNKENRIYGTV